MNQARLHQSILKLWYGHSRWYFLLLPLTGLYRSIIFLRRYCYRFGLFKITRLRVPVIIVGNLTVGGTGKTPLVIQLAKLLKQAGFQPGIISRGYGAKASVYPMGIHVDSDPAIVGDEAVLLAKHANCPIVIDPQRAQAGQLLIDQYYCNVLLSDDGLQHTALARDIEIIVIDGARGFGNGHCLPAGPLREPLTRLEQVNFILEQDQLLPHTTSAMQKKLFTFVLKPINFVNLKHQIQQTHNDFAGKSIHAFAGIGNPQRFFKNLRQLGLSIIEHPMPDHYAYSAHDFAQLDQNAIIIMTEKDAVKCKDFATEHFWYLAIECEISQDFSAALITKLNQL